MSAGAISVEARRLARHRAEMELALAEGLSLDQARMRIAETHLRRTALCGTHADAPRTETREPARRSWMHGYDNY